MNKFKYLQTIGTVIVFLPAILAIGGAITYTFGTSKEVETETVTVEIATPKVDTVVVVKEVAPVAPPAPVVKKLVPVPAPAPAPQPPKVVKDTAIEVELKVAAELDTTK